MNERILALDIGDVRIGVAVSDMTRTIATPVEVIKRVGFGPDVKRISALCQQYETTEILSGLPLNMDGTEGFQAQKVKLLCQQLEKAGFTVYYQDERLTTVTAEESVTNTKAAAFYRDHGVERIVEPLELAPTTTGSRVMQSAYCLRREMGECLKEHPRLKGDLYLETGGHKYRLEFDCKRCEMNLIDCTK